MKLGDWDYVVPGWSEAKRKAIEDPSVETGPRFAVRDIKKIKATNIINQCSKARACFVYTMLSRKPTLPPIHWNCAF